MRVTDIHKNKIFAALSDLKIIPFKGPIPETFDALNVLLKKMYYSSAWRVHPDHQGDKESFQKLQSSYETLVSAAKTKLATVIGIISENSISVSSEDMTNISDKIYSENISASEIFNDYKKASQSYSEALEIYFSKINQVTLEKDGQAYKELINNLTVVKNHLAKILKKDPGSMVADDVIEKIARVNIWIGEKK